MDDLMPKSWKKETVYSLFCPGCGHSLALKELGFVIDDLNLQRAATIGIDIGCSLLAWNFFDIDTVQTHHGRTVPVMVGYKMAKPERISIAYMGDGGAYAIGLQSLLHAASRGEPICVIVVNNGNYAMTGGQMSPTTMFDAKTSTSPAGKRVIQGVEFRGPEFVANFCGENSFVGRASVKNPLQMKNMLKKAIKNQIDNNGFSFLEILSLCPTNWKTNSADGLKKISEMEKAYPLGEFKKTI